MSTLKTLEKARLEDLLDMAGGYVLDFNDSSFAEFFRDNGSINIDSSKYSNRGTSKAKRLRTFWDLESQTSWSAVYYKRCLSTGAIGINTRTRTKTDSQRNANVSSRDY